MFYIIGGAPRSGKSMLAQKMVREKQVPSFPLDALIGTLTFAAPEFNINHDQPFTKKSEMVWKFTEHLFGYFLEAEDSYLVEGDCILPVHTAELIKKYPKDIRVCFLGYTDLSMEQKLNFIRTFNRGELDWTNEHTDEALLPMIDRMIEYSKFIKTECTRYNIPYFDVSVNFEETHKKVYEYLTNLG